MKQTDPAIQRIAIDLPVQVAREVKAAAALAGLRLSDYCTNALAASVASSPPENKAA